MRETLTKAIGKYTYKVTQLGAKKGRQASFRLLKMLGPVAKAFTKTEGLDVETLTVNAIAQMAAEADSNDFEFLCDALAETSSVLMPMVMNGESKTLDQALGPIFDDHFAGNYGEMVLWLAFAIQVNFTSFLDVKTAAISLSQGLKSKEK